MIPGVALRHVVALLVNTELPLTTGSLVLQDVGLDVGLDAEDLGQLIGSVRPALSTCLDGKISVVAVHQSHAAVKVHRQIAVGAVL